MAKTYYYADRQESVGFSTYHVNKSANEYQPG
ncbi:hypothetical protein L915_00009 [Phytophthora nicotianae]|nr:hypothetical protein L915_00009 [Phytophthora nicotianae]ETM34011.1 hypothetical protein L914_18807 [Phytophthora nicotianae]